MTDIDGAFSGAVTLPMLTAVPQDRVASTRVRDVAGRQPLLTTTPSQDLSTVLLPMHLRGGIAIVLDQGHPIGVVTDGDLARLAAHAGGRSATGT